MKKTTNILLTLFAFAVADASALAEPVKTTRGDAKALALSIANLDVWLTNGFETELADGDKKKIVRKPYELDVATRFALAKAKRAAQPIADEIEAINNAKVGEVAQTPSEKNPQGLPTIKDQARVDAEFRKELAEPVTLDVTVIDAGVFNRFSDKLPIFILSGLDPILKNKPQ